MYDLKESQINKNFVCAYLKLQISMQCNFPHCLFHCDYIVARMHDVPTWCSKLNCPPVPIMFPMALQNVYICMYDEYIMKTSWFQCHGSTHTGHALLTFNKQRYISKRKRWYSNLLYTWGSMLMISAERVGICLI